MPRLTKNEWCLVKSACDCLWDSLDITNSELKYRTSSNAQTIYKKNVKDMKTLERIVKKINKVE